MKKLIAITGIGTALAAAAIAGGVGVAVAHDDHGDMRNHQAMMDGTAMDAAGMQDHMRQLLGDETYQKMQDAMQQALGQAGYQKMLDQMTDGCSSGTTMQGTNGSATMPGHDAHHAATPAASTN